MTNIIEVAVQVYEVPRNVLYLQQDLGRGEFNGKPFVATTIVPDGSLYLTYDGKRYIVKTQDLIHTVLTKISEVSNEG